MFNVPFSATVPHTIPVTLLDHKPILVSLLVQLNIADVSEPLNTIGVVLFVAQIEKLDTEFTDGVAFTVITRVLLVDIVLEQPVLLAIAVTVSVVEPDALKLLPGILIVPVLEAITILEVLPEETLAPLSE